MRKTWAGGRTGLFPVLVIAVLAWAAPAAAQQAAADPVPPLDVLDGRLFVGEIGPAGQSSGRQDRFIFADGKFHSEACLKWGFTPGPYWVRLENGRLKFLAQLTSAENGVMTYRGTVDGATIDAHVDWVKPRWYWTMENSLWVRGTGDGTAAVGGK